MSVLVAQKSLGCLQYSVPQCPESSASSAAEPCDIDESILPPVNFDCWQMPPPPKPVIKYIEHDLQTEEKVVEKNYEDVKVYVIENVVHHQHNKRVITTVNRNHLHTQRIITKENNYHHFNTDYIVKVNDIHRQVVENLTTEGAEQNDYKQTLTVEPATCELKVESACAAPLAIECAEQCVPAQEACCDESVEIQQVHPPEGF